MRVSLIQVNCQENKAENLKTAYDLVERAVAEDRPDLVILPEMWTCLTEDNEAKRACADTLPVTAHENESGGESYEMLRNLAASRSIYLHGGSLLERDGEDYYNTSVIFDPQGREIGRYRKIHLFDVVTPDGKEYRESSFVRSGNEFSLFRVGERTFGCTICYDLRFPELYQELARQGADVICVPAAFTMQTGKDHWETLLRARAIETETYILAPSQCGRYDGGRRAIYGNSMIVSPWGRVIARAEDDVAIISGTLDFRQLTKMRQAIPVHMHKRVMGDKISDALLP